MSVNLSVKSALQQARGIDLLDAQVLLAHVLCTTRAALYSHDDRVLTEAEQEQWHELLNKRIEGIPVAYLVGEKECWGLTWMVTPDVLIPRPDTECVIEAALSWVKPGHQVLDMCTGSGVIACAIAKAEPHCHVLATDISEAALIVAQQNITRHGLHNVICRRSDVFVDIPELFDLIVANPPYLSDDDPYLRGEIRFEPIQALVAEEEGLAILRRVIEGAVTHLKSGGMLCVEHGFNQAQPVRDKMCEQGLEDIITLKDLSGHERVTCGKRPSTIPL